jgi:glyoxylase-like metal-dependent hydrolase (beta-lactamase superfamily II)
MQPMHTDLSDTPRARFGPVTVYFGEKSGKYPDGNQVIVQGGDTVVAFDTPKVANRLGAAVFDDAVDLVVLGHVHEDHMCGLHRLPGVPVHVHEHDVEAARSWEGLRRHFGYPAPALDAFRQKLDVDFHYAPRPDAIAYADGATWDLGGGVRVRAVHLPGHTAGHCALVVEPAGIAFIGDIDLSTFGPYYGDATSNLGDFRRSLARLPELDASVWITSHHKGVYTERAAFEDALRAYTARLDEREAVLVERLRVGPASLDDLASAGFLYPAGFPSPSARAIERRSISQHLDELLAAGRVVAQESGAELYALAS